ncbi:hypothetical protein [Paraburkholderia sp. MM5384-R2]|uniref:hypothetical protein n=1 Tax=Paraburkholderia sp. MM5384-R2 TaxID=2723097 RepID=UPI00161DAA4A|nr:hypothetical protein [Paraburkholderia sp. MM5384-R2]
MTHAGDCIGAIAHLSHDVRERFSHPHDSRHHASRIAGAQPGALGKIAAPNRIGERDQLTRLRAERAADVAHDKHRNATTDHARKSG